MREVKRPVFSFRLNLDNPDHKKASEIQNGEYIFKSHDYRHTVATNFYEHGVSIQSIRDYLGHTFEEMTMQYIDYMPRKIAKQNDTYFEKEGNSLLACMQKGEQNE